MNTHAVFKNHFKTKQYIKMKPIQILQIHLLSVNIIHDR